MFNKGRHSLIPSLRDISLKAVFAFAASLLICLGITSIVLERRLGEEHRTIEMLIDEKSDKIHEMITKFLYKTQGLSALVIQSNGNIDKFELVASNIIDDPAILNILIAPGGIVSHVYPLEGNEGVLHYNLLGPCTTNNLHRRKKGRA